MNWDWRSPYFVVAIVFLAALILIGTSRAGGASGLFGGPRFPECPQTATQQGCWHETLKTLLDGGRVIDALDYLRVSLAQSPGFINVCHSFAHEVGEKAYEEFSGNKTIALSPEMQVCDFGFYHGFMTSFLYESHNYTELGAFCTSTPSDEREGLADFSRSACFHGIGHGSVIWHLPKEWSDPHAVLAQALKTCHASAKSAQDLQDCIEGAFNGMAYGPYRDVMDTRDPLKICNTLSEKDLPQECYANLASVVFNLAPHKTVGEALTLAKSYRNVRYLDRMVATFANMASRQEGSDDETIATCLKLEPALKESCLRGFVSGLVQAAPPDSKAERTYDFCASGTLSDAESHMCFVQSFDTLASFWTAEKMAAACADLPKAGATACKAAYTEWSGSRQVQ